MAFKKMECLLIALVSASLVNRPELSLDVERVFQGELWRMLTCHLVHLDSLHLILNLTGFLILIFFSQSKSKLVYLIFSFCFVSCGLLFTLKPNITYVGLSGVLYGFAVYVLWIDGRESLGRLLTAAAFLLLISKLGWDFLSVTQSPVVTNGSVIVEAHAFGILSGVVWLLGQALWRNLDASQKKREIALTSFTAVLLFALSPALAADAQESHSVHEQAHIPWLDYRRLSFNLGVGFVRGSLNQGDVEASLREAGVMLDEFSLNVNRPGYQLGLAYELSDNFHIEAMYFNFGRVEVEASSSGITEDQLAGAFQDRLPGTGAGPLLSLKYNRWIGNPYHRLFARAGLFSASSGYDLTAGATISRHENTIVVGGGYEYFYRKGLSIRGELNTTRLNNELIWYAGPTLVFYLDGVPRESVPQNNLTEKSQVATSVKVDSPERLQVTIYFDFDKSNLRDVERPKVDEVARFTQKYSDSLVILTGHTDSFGSNEYNVQLSKNRIQIVEEALREKSIDHSQISQKHYGEEAAADGNWTSLGRQKNRRVNVCVVSHAEAASELCLGTGTESEIPRGDWRFVCRKNGYEVRVEARHERHRAGGCSVMMKRGQYRWVKTADSNKDLEICHDKIMKHKSDLENSGYECIDESGD